MSSYEPAACCRVVHALHEGTPNGRMEQISGIECYISETEDKSHANTLLFFPDVLGHKFPNCQLLADQFAVNGFRVIIPDIFRGDPMPENRGEDFDSQAWMRKHDYATETAVIAKSIVEHVKQDSQVQKTAAIGYCWGAKVVFDYVGSNPLAVDVGAVAHPSMVTLEQVADVKKPITISAAETDAVFPEQKRHETEDKLKEIGATYTLQLFSQAQHGFAVRGDLKKPMIKFAKEKAFQQAVEWFKFHM